MSKEKAIYLDPGVDNSKRTISDKGRMARDCMIGWAERIEEAIDTYQPDMVWFDTSFGGTVSGELKGHFDEGRLVVGGDNRVGGVAEEIQQRVISHYFNQALEWGRDVEVIYKSHDIPPDIGMRDIENGNLTGLQYDPWMADINMVHHYVWPSTWFYNPENPPKDANALVDMLVDMANNVESAGCVFATEAGVAPTISKLNGVWSLRSMISGRRISNVAAFCRTVRFRTVW